MPTVQDIASALEAWAPAASKLDYDNVGLQVGHSNREVKRVLVALDLTPPVIEEAVKLSAEVIVTHHPLFFRPQNRLVGIDPIGGMVLRMAEQGIAYYAIHTNLDVAHGGVSFALAEKLGLDEIRFLDPAEGDLVKLVVFVPETHAEAVRLAVAEAGAGRIGDYEACSFETKGTGRFRPRPGSNPHVGEPGGSTQSVEEVRLEVEVLRWTLARVLEAVRTAHPYEEVAHDVYPMEQSASRIGSGAIGTLPEAMPLEDFLARVSERLSAEALRYSGNSEQSIKNVAVCGGSGSSLIRRAMAEGADAFVTADITYHRFFETIDPDGRHRMALVDPGHYETEAHTEQLIVDYLAPRFTDVTFTWTQIRTSEMETFVRS